MAETINIEIDYGNIQRPVLHKKAFYKIYSPGRFKLKPTEHIHLNLDIKIKTMDYYSDAKFDLLPKCDLLPTLKHLGLLTKENNWKNSDNFETIKLCILNKNYLNTFNIKKGQIIAYLLLPNLKPNTRIRTKYTDTIMTDLFNYLDIEIDSYTDV